jgi:hypothetical protein
MHVVAIPVGAGNKLEGAAMTSGLNRLEAQRSDFMAHMRYELGLRPDRSPRMASLAKSPTTHVAMPTRDRGVERNLIARQPHSPTCEGQPHSPQDTDQPQAHNLILRRLTAVRSIFSDAASANALPSVPTWPLTAAPRPAGSDEVHSLKSAARLSTGNIAILAPLGSANAKPAECGQTTGASGPSADPLVLTPSARALCVAEDAATDDPPATNTCRDLILSLLAETQWASTEEEADPSQTPTIYTTTTHADRSCRSCSNQTRSGTCSEPVVAGLAECFILVWAPDACVALQGIRSGDHAEPLACDSPRTLPACDWPRTFWLDETERATRPADPVSI